MTLLALLDLVGSGGTGLEACVMGEGATVLVAEFLLVSAVILEVVFLCCCGDDDALEADAVVGGNPRVTEEAAGVFGIGGLGKSSPKQYSHKFD